MILEGTSGGQLGQASAFGYHLSLNPETRVCGQLNNELPRSRENGTKYWLKECKSKSTVSSLWAPIGGGTIFT